MIFALRVAVATSLAMPIAVTAQPASRVADTRAVEAVLSQYKAAIEKLDAKGTERLFAADSQIFETGGSEGTYATYLAHHLGPELAAFKSFTFSNYKVSVRFEGPVALATETYRVRRQNIWHNSRRKLAECGPRPGVDIKRRSCGGASGDVRWSSV